MFSFISFNYHFVALASPINLFFMFIAQGKN